MDYQEELKDLRDVVGELEMWCQSHRVWPRRLFDRVFAIIDKLQEKT